MAGAQGTGGTICIDPGLGTITLVSQIGFPPTPGLSLAIVGNGATVVGSRDGEYGTALEFDSETISNNCRFHHVCPPVETISISSMTFTGGQGRDGGAVWTGEGVDLSLDHDVFRSNSAGPRNVGGAVDVDDLADLTITDSSFIDNTDACDSCGGDGGGAVISNGSPITVSGSTFAGNSTSGPGGAIDAGYGGPVVITDSTFSGNTSSGGNNNLGGAVFATGDLDVVASTFVGNTATSGGTLWDNDTTSVAGSILRGVSGVGTCAGGPVTSDGYSLSDEAVDSCGLTGPGDRVAAGSLAALGPLAANGGPTQTVMPLAGSPATALIPADTTLAVDGQPTRLCPTVDQRGVASAPAGRCSAGSVQGEAPAITSARAATFTAGRPGSSTVTATGVPAPTFSSTGPLPRGVTLDGTTGVLSGTAPTPGVFRVTVTATNGNPPDATQRFTLTVLPPPVGDGYWLAGADGGVFSYGSAPFVGSAAGLHLNRPIVAAAATPDHRGYWLVAADGGVFAFGDARYAGSVPGLGLAPAGTPGPAPHLSSPIVGVVPSAGGRGYLLVGSDGGVFAFGDARFAGSCPGSGGCPGPVVAMVGDRTGDGYWMVTATGRLERFGDAPTLGEPGPQSTAAVGAAGTPGGDGYRILLADGAVFAYGDAAYHGGATGLGVADPAAAIGADASGDGYWITTGQGMVEPFGSAPNDGGPTSRPLDAPVVAVAGS
jgi:hypothetical protein